jgi:hypothetical protein
VANPPLEGDSSNGVIPAVRGINTGATSNIGNAIGVWGESTHGQGVGGLSNADGYAGVSGQNTGGGPAVQATSNTGTAIYATQTGEPDSLPDAVLVETSSNGHAAVAAHNNGKGIGVWAFSQEGNAILATNDKPGTADADAFVAFTSSPNHAAVAAHNNSNGFGVWAFSQGGVALKAVQGSTGNPAGYFEGDCHVTGTHFVDTDIVLTASDCAEEFDIAESEVPDPGTVMVLDNNGCLAPSAGPYDKRVAGVISGAGEFKPGLILGRSQPSPSRLPVALVGKVYCKVDASYAPIEIGDLLTTSPTRGHAMKAEDPLAGFGAVIGKALKPLGAGQSLLPILVALQ